MQAYSSILLVSQTKSKTEFEPTKGKRQRQGHSNTCDNHRNLSVSCSLVLHENKLML